MSDLFSSDFFRGNRERLKALFTGTAPIVVTANGLLQKGSDEAFPFHQDGNFWYLTGVDEPDVVLVMDKNKEYLIVPSRESVREAFDGAVDFDELKRRSGIGKILDEKDGWRQLESRLKKVKHVATLAANPKYIEHFGLYANPARAELIHRLKEINGEAELLDLRPHLARLRMIKQESELAALQRAIDITIATLKAVTQPAKLKKYAHEYEIEADITRGFRRRGAAGHAFTPIVASGQRACTMHYMANNGQLSSDELVLFDLGTDFDHYSSDIARTVSLSGQPSRRQQAVHTAVAEAQDYAFSLLKPGVLPSEYEQQVEEFMGEKLRELNLIKTIDHETVRKFFPHRTSHFLGIDTHDAGDYDRPLEPGVVLAVEPGIYIPEEGIGVRIEDDVLITADGIKNLSANLPRELA
ncbi:MAG TPA: Xaa-Pro peptidase family protein [Candidatus Saccharimonadales bacterium]|jgi:Xaa-Pro aminopeptidase